MERILGVIAALLTILLLATIVFVGTDSYGEFEYRTASGQTGTAKYCALSYGQARGQTVDNEIVIVESYRKVK